MESEQTFEEDIAATFSRLKDMLQENNYTVIGNLNCLTLNLQLLLDYLTQACRSLLGSLHHYRQLNTQLMVLIR
jgi:hypothetical protein